MKAMNTLLIGLGALAVVGSGFAALTARDQGFIWTPLATEYGVKVPGDAGFTREFNLRQVGAMPVVDSTGKPMGRIMMYKVEMDK